MEKIQIRKIKKEEGREKNQFLKVFFSVSSISCLQSIQKTLPYINGHTKTNKKTTDRKSLK